MQLEGDKDRFLQVLVTIIKYSLKSTFEKDIEIKPSFDPQSERLVIKVIAGGENNDD